MEHRRRHSLSVVYCRTELEIVVFLRGATFVLIKETYCVTDLHQELVFALICVEAEEDGVRPLFWPQCRHDAEVLGKSICWGRTKKRGLVCYEFMVTIGWEDVNEGKQEESIARDGNMEPQTKVKG